MPTYDYCCEDCGCPFHVERPIRDQRADVRCPRCLGFRVRRVIGRTSFILKPGGSGWSDKGYGGSR